MQHIPFEKTRMLAHQAEIGIDSLFLHVKDIMHAISKNEKTLSVDDSVTKLDFSNLRPEDAKTMAFKNTTTVYEFMNIKLHSLDSSDAIDGLRKLDDKSLHYCHADEPLNVGDVFVGSEHGALHHSHSAKHPAHLSDYLQSPKMVSNKGFILIPTAMCMEQKIFTHLTCLLLLT